MGVSHKPRSCHGLVWLLSALSLGLASPSTSHVKRQYIAPAPEILPAPEVEPAPLVLPSGAVEPAGAIVPAGLISPAPLIAPAPAILPADAITEKERASPGPKGKRYGIPMEDYDVQSLDSNFDTNQYPPQYSNQNELTTYGDLEPEKYESWRPGSTALEQRDSLNYFDPGFGTKTNEVFTGSSATSFGPQFSDLIEDENKLANSLIHEVDEEGSAIESSSFDNSQSKDGQAVSQGLVTAQTLSASELKNTPLVEQTEGDNSSSNQSAEDASGQHDNSSSHAELSANVSSDLLSASRSSDATSDSQSDASNSSSSSLSSSPSSSASSPPSVISDEAAESSAFAHPALSHSSESESQSTLSLPGDMSLPSLEATASEYSQISSSHARNNGSKALLSNSQQQWPIPAANHSTNPQPQVQEVASDSITGEKKNLQASDASFPFIQNVSNAAVERKAASLGKSAHRASTDADRPLAGCDPKILSNVVASTLKQHDSLSSIIAASERRLQLSKMDKTMPSVTGDQTAGRSPRHFDSAPTLVDSEMKPAKAKSKFSHLKMAGASLVPSKLFAPCGLGVLNDGATTAPPPTSPRTAKAPRPTVKPHLVVLPTQTHHIKFPTQKEPEGPTEKPTVHPTQSGFIRQDSRSAGSQAAYAAMEDTREKTLGETRFRGGHNDEAIVKYVGPTKVLIQRKAKGTAMDKEEPIGADHGNKPIREGDKKGPSNAKSRKDSEPIRTGVNKRDILWTNDLSTVEKGSAIVKDNLGGSYVDLKSLIAKSKRVSKNPSTYMHNRETRLSLDSKRSGHVIDRRQVLLLPLDNNPSPVDPLLTQAQPLLDPTQPGIPILSQFQQPVQPDLSTQPLLGPQPADGMLSLSPLLTQPELAPAANPVAPIAGIPPIMQFAPQRNEIGFPQPLPQALPQPLAQPLPQALPQPLAQPLPQALPQPRQFLAPIGSPSPSFDAPYPSPGKLPNMLAATQAYKDLQVLNSRSHMLDEVMKNIGGDRRYIDGKDDDTWENLDTPKYTGKRRYSDLSAKDFDFSNRNDFGSDPFRESTREHEYDEYAASEADEYGWRPREAWHRPARKFSMEDGRDGLSAAEIVDRRFHPADDTTENAIKESPGMDTGYHRDEDGASDDVAHTSRSYSEAVTSPSDMHEQDSDEESENGKQKDASEKKADQHSDLKDITEEDDEIEEKKAASPPAQTSLQSKDRKKIKMRRILERLNSDSVMHLNFDKPPHNRKNLADDQSGNGNDANLENGATISARNFGTCGHGVDLNKGEIVYHSKSFIRKPTEAVSIAMWVKSRKPGLVRWFDFGNGAKTEKGGKAVTVPRNRWTHLAGTYETKTGVSRVYVNGQLLSERVGKVEKDLPQDFTATGLGHKFGDEFVAFLDDLYMFDRVISPDEVKALYGKCEFNRMVLHFGFQKVNMSLPSMQLHDQSGLENNATILGGAHILTSGCDKCGACLDASSGKRPGVYMDGSSFHRKPTSGVTIAAWISLNRTNGLHSIFQALDDEEETISVYNMEVVDGHLHWRHINERYGVPTFDFTTESVVVPENMWIHVAATYNSTSGNAKLYVNGIQKADYTNLKKPQLSSSWGKMTIGGHFQKDSPFEGLLDEVLMYNWELDPSELHFVMKYCADHPKLVSFTVRVPIYKRQHIQHHTKQQSKNKHLDRNLDVEK